MNGKTPEVMPGNDKPYKMGCKLSGQGRGDCEHFIGLPEKFNETTTDEYGIPLGWCDFCWIEFRSRTERTAADELRKENKRLEAKLLMHLTEPYDRNTPELVTLRTFVKKAAEALKSCKENDRSKHYAHHEKRPHDDKKPEGYPNGTRWATPYEIASAILTDPTAVEIMKEKV